MFPNGNYKVRIINGDQFWFVENSDANVLLCIVFANGDKFWYGKSASGDSYLHREDGPAIEFSFGEKEYYIEGVQISKEEFALRCAEKRG